MQGEGAIDSGGGRLDSLGKAVGYRTGSWGKSWQGPTDAQQDHEPPREGKWSMSVV